MFIINQKEYTEITDTIFKNCCQFCSPYICSESDCDIHKIYELLNKHLYSENDNIEYDEKLPF